MDVAKENEMKRMPLEMIWETVAASAVSLLREGTNVQKFEQ
jgi:hypothetical protein